MGEYSMKDLYHHVWSRLEKVSTLDTNSPEERRRKATLVVITILCCYTGIFSGTRSFLISEPVSSIIIPFTFSIFSGIALIIFFVTKRFTVLLYSFLFLILLIPVIFQLLGGGYTEPGSIPIVFWAILAPFSSLMFQNLRKAF